MLSSPSAARQGTSFYLNVTLGYGADGKTEEELNKACSKQTFGLSEVASSFFSGSSSAMVSSLQTLNSGNRSYNGNQDRFFVASASHVRLCINPSEKQRKTNTHLIVVFVHPQMIASALEKHFPSNQVASGSSFWINPPSSSDLSKDLLPRIHPTALTGCRICGIVLTSIAASNGPSELLILEVPKARSIQDDILRVTNGCTIATDSDPGPLKILPLTTIEFNHKSDDGDETLYSEKKMGQSIRSNIKPSITCSSFPSSTKFPEIPACPICIHRIDPIRLGLPVPCVQQLCSKFCRSPSLIVGSFETEEETCHKQKLLKKWAPPARCKACQVIDHYWNSNNGKYGNREEEDDCDLFCGECSMHKTLWTCLTCGFVGCGRYSNKHSFAHFEQTQHPYSLELATLRIWNYCHGEYGGFVQRADLLECPSSPPSLFLWTRGLDFCNHSESISPLERLPYNHLSDSLYPSTIDSSLSKATEKSSKKVMMIGEEYEALLRSALEDQAQHYEDEMTRLRAKHADSLLDRDSMIPEEVREIEELRIEIRIARLGVEKASKELIESQIQEVELRAASRRLLSEQQESNALLKKMREEHRKKNEEGKIQRDNFEQEIADLSANLRMRRQFSRDNEFANAQIFGTASAPDSRHPGYRKGKKKGRFSRK